MRAMTKTAVAVLVFALPSAWLHAQPPILNRQIEWSIPAGNVWHTLPLYLEQGGTVVRLRCNFCSGPQPCQSGETSRGGCVPQCPMTDREKKRTPQACSLPCAALDHITTQPVTGRWSLVDALERMLEGTGMTFSFLSRSDQPFVEVVLLDARRHFDIAAGPFIETGDAFTDQSGVRTVIPTRIFNRAQTEAVQGYLTPREALQTMLRGSGLLYGPHPEYREAVYIRESPAQVLVMGHRPASGVQTTVAGQIQSIEQPQLKLATYASVDEALRELPVTATFTGVNETFDRANNVAGGTAVNLRGLGPQVTLVLVNGRRQPSSGLDGNFVDLQTMPWSAVERIDILADGASATYGAGAIGGVVNIVMRKDVQGAETRVHNTELRGGGSERLLSQLLAHHWNSGMALFAYQFSRREALPIRAREYAADTDKRPFGGDDFSSPAGNPGSIIDPATLQPAYAIPSGQDGTSLAVSDLAPGAQRFNWATGADLLPERQTHSTYLSASQRLGDRWALSGDARATWRRMSEAGAAQARLLTVPSSNPFFVSPYGGDAVLVDYNFLADLGTTNRTGSTRTLSSAVGLTRVLNERWQTTLTTNYGEDRLATRDHNLVNDAALADALADSNPRTAFNAFGSGTHTALETLDRIRDTLEQRATSTLGEFSWTFDGRSRPWRNGAVRTSGGISYRLEKLERSVRLRSFEAHSEHARRSLSSFAEITLPLAPTLDVSVAGRAERFSQAGSAIAPKAVLRWSPRPSLRMRGSWGHSYRPPDLLDLDVRDRSSIGFLTIPDPRAASGRSLALIRFGANSDLREETASTWTAGFDVSLRPTETTLSLTYFSVDYRDRVVIPGTLPAINTLTEELEWANIITRAPSRAAIDELCRSPHLFGSAQDCLASAPSVIIDARVRNGGATRATGLDWTIEQPWSLWGHPVRWQAIGTQLLSFTQADGSFSPAAGTLALVENPPRTRIRSSLDWYQRGVGLSGFSAGIAASYVSGFRDTTRPDQLSQVRASTLLDLNFSYRTPPNSAPWASDLELIFKVSNVTDEAPPFVNRPVGYDTANALPYGRGLMFSAQKNF